MGMLRKRETERGCLAVGSSIVDERSLAGALLGIVTESVPVGMFAAFLAVLHGVTMLTAPLAEHGGARVVAALESNAAGWMPIWAACIEAWMHIRGCWCCCWRSWTGGGVKRVDLSLGCWSRGVSWGSRMVDSLHQRCCGWGWCGRCKVGHWGRWWSLVCLEGAIDCLTHHVD